MLRIILSLAVLGGLIIVLQSPPTSEVTTPSGLELSSGEVMDVSTALGTCNRAIRQVAISPKSVKFHGFNEPVLIGEMWAYSPKVSWKNAYGVRLEGTFVCVIEADGKPQIEKL